MAERYGGKYSAGGKTDNARAAPASPLKGRKSGPANLMFIAPLALIWRAFTSEPVQLAQYLVALGLLLLAAWLTRQGIEAQNAYDARKIAKRPMPRKILGSICTGLGLAVVGIAGHGMLEAAIFAVLGAALHLFAFGPDPLTDKGAEGIDAFQTDRVARAVDEAEKHLAAMSDAILRAGTAALEKRVAAFQKTVREMFRTIEDDPRDLTGARKYLSVYLLGARDATVKFADLYARTKDEGARADYESLLDDLEANFSAQTEKLLTDNRSDLDIEIEVLRDRLAREGVRPE